MARKALVIGIDKYKKYPLRACVNDARCVSNLLEKHDDGTTNFEVKQLFDKAATRANIRKSIRNLFKGDDEIALMYFSGHGVDDDNDGFIASCDFVEDDYGFQARKL